ncbi:MAG TPA: urease subunit gamma [Nitrososphaeraceae archaeon]
MISVKALVKGENDVPPFRVVFEYLHRSDELIFLNSVNMIREKLSKNLKVNTNEALTLYCNYIISQIRIGIPICTIETEAKRLLSIQHVMIGVPETLKKIIFEASIDHIPKQTLTIYEPIPIPTYVLITDI